MATYLLIESRDPFESNDVPYYYDLAKGLSQGGHNVTLFLVQNGVIPARTGARADGLTELASGGVTVLADDFSLRERGITTEQLASGVAAAPLDDIVDHMAAGSKTIWH